MPFSTRPHLWQPDPTDPHVRHGLSGGVVVTALAQQALGPQWEVATAFAQQQAGDPNAGLSEEERAAKAGLAARAKIINGTASSQSDPGQFRPVILDFNGDGRLGTVGKGSILTPANAATGTAATPLTFDWDGSGYLKLTGWLADGTALNSAGQTITTAATGDAFLTIDRNGNNTMIHRCNIVKRQYRRGSSRHVCRRGKRDRGVAGYGLRAVGWIEGVEGEIGLQRWNALETL